MWSPGVTRRWTFAILIALAWAVWTVPTLPGQQLNGSIIGLVQDANGPVAGAIVRVQNTRIETVSAEDGSFTLTGVVSDRPVKVTAARKGYFIRWSEASPGQTDVVITLERHNLGDNDEGYVWQSATACGECHTAYREWQGDAHARSATNPRFLTMYQGTDIHGNRSPLTEYLAEAEAKSPDLSQPYYGPGFQIDFPNRTGNCAACHTPLASTLDTSNGCGWSGCHTEFTASVSDQIPPGVSPVDLTGVAAEGINCDFCHKIGNVLLNPDQGTPDHDKPGILSLSIYRPLADQELLFGTVQDVARIADSYLPLQAESAFCAGCHYGAITQTVVYNSFGEWLASPYSDPETGQTCQQCHMPPVEVEAGHFPEARPAAPTNFFVYPNQGGLRRDPNQVHNHRMLGINDAAFMRNSVAMTTTAQRQADRLQVEVAITNVGAGHDLPTDFPLRHMLLVVRAFDSAGQPLALVAGPQLPDWAGDYAAQPGWGYAKIMEDAYTGQTPAMSHWRPARIVSDTRIPARASDSRQFTFTAPPAGPVTVEATLIYRRAFQQLLLWKGWDDPDFVMAEDRLTVE